MQIGTSFFVKVTVAAVLSMATAVGLGIGPSSAETRVVPRSTDMDWAAQVDAAGADTALESFVRRKRTCFYRHGPRGPGYYPCRRRGFVYPYFHRGFYYRHGRRLVTSRGLRRHAVGVHRGVGASRGARIERFRTGVNRYRSGVAAPVYGARPHVFNQQRFGQQRVNQQRLGAGAGFNRGAVRSPGISGGARVGGAIPAGAGGGNMVGGIRVGGPGGIGGAGAARVGGGGQMGGGHTGGGGHIGGGGGHMGGGGGGGGHGGH